MAVSLKTPLPPVNIPWVNPDDGRLALLVAQYMPLLDATVRALAAGQLGTLVNAPNDHAAAIAGVPVGSVYRNGSQVLIRVS